ncbi:MAG: MBL fold metallo-hydrolase, partial [Acetobacteraceae bacterium]|nr:MBL fold metallo-hydrolase [Acetobacteraceae bacterium]
RHFRHLDAVAISHAHSDHMGGMRAIIAAFRPAEFWYGYEANSPEFLALKQAAQDYGVRLKSFHSGDSFAFGGTQFRVLNPQPGSQATDRTMDDVSLVLRLQYRETLALLEGDSHRKIEQLLIADNPRADVLKIAHHGSLTSSSPEFLAAVAPKYAVVSAGFYNPFRHPRPEVMARYAGSHVITYRTDIAGAVSFYLDGKTVRAKPVLR